MNQTLLNSLANPTNHVAQAFEARTNQLEGDRAASDKQRDNDMLRVFEFAGDGQTEAAKLYASQKGVEIPEEIYQNADFAKGLTLAGKIYGDDPVAAQKFTTAWSAAPGIDFNERLTMAQDAAGVPINTADRDYQRKIDFEMWKIKNIPRAAGSSGQFNLSPGQTRFDRSGNPVASIDAAPPISRFEAGQRAANDAMASFGSSTDIAEQARQNAMRFWDQEFGQPAPQDPQPVNQPFAPASQGLVGDGAAPQAAPILAPASAWAALQANPELAGEFDRKYGQGASATLLGR